MLKHYKSFLHSCKALAVALRPIRSSNICLKKKGTYKPWKRFLIWRRKLIEHAGIYIIIIMVTLIDKLVLLYVPYYDKFFDAIILTRCQPITSNSISFQNFREDPATMPGFLVIILLHMQSLLVSLFLNSEKTN